MARLGVIVDSIAAFRTIGGSREPDPVNSAMLAELGGADSIVCSLNEDLNPVTKRDVRLLKEVVKSFFNVRIPPAEKLVSMIISIDPDMVTLIPNIDSIDRKGLDMLGHFEKISKIITNIRSHNIIVSVMIEPMIQQMKAAAKSHADYIEFNLSKFGASRDLNVSNEQLENISSLCAAAAKLNLGVAAGSGLDYKNINDVINISQIEEFNVGHAVFSRAVSIGMEAAVRDFVSLVH